MVQKIVAGMAVGLVTSLLGVAAHAGFPDMPVAGLVFALILVGAGAWFVFEWFSAVGWAAYLLVLFAVTTFLVLVPHSADILVSPALWVSQTYTVAAPVTAAIVGALASRGRAEQIEAENNNEQQGGSCVD